MITNINHIHVKQLQINNEKPKTAHEWAQQTMEMKQYLQQLVFRNLNALSNAEIKRLKCLRAHVSLPSLPNSTPIPLIASKLLTFTVTLNIYYVNVSIFPVSPHDNFFDIARKAIYKGAQYRSPEQCCFLYLNDSSPNNILPMTFSNKTAQLICGESFSITQSVYVCLASLCLVK